MPTTGTTVGPLTEEVRDALAAYRDRNGHANYDVALDALLSEHED